MTIDKAIGILTLLLNWEEVDVNLDVKVSVKLGIEALKWRRAKEIRDGPSMYLPLPGETEK